MTTMWGAPLHKRWRGSRLRDPRQAKFLTVASLKWVLANRAYTPWYLVRYWRLLKFKLANPHIITRGMVFLGKGVEIQATPELSTMEIGRWVHIGDKNTIRCHEGSLRFGDKVVLGRDNVINTYLDIELGDSVLMADWCYVCDFDHRMDSIELPIKDQGIVKGPVRIGPDTWIATKVTILRDTTIGRGCVLGLACRGQGRDPGLLDRRRRAGQGGQEPQAGVGDVGRPARRAGRGAGRHRAQEGLPLGAPVDAERVGQCAAAVVGNRERPPAWHPFHPARRQETTQHGAPEPAGQMVPLLGPVHTVAHEWPFARWHFDAYSGQKVSSGVGQLVMQVAAGAAQRVVAVAVRVKASVAADERLAIQQVAHDSDPEAARDMVIARAGRAQPRRAGALPKRSDGPRRREAHKMFEQLADLRTGQPVVAVPAMGLDRQQARAGQLAEVAAGCRPADARFVGEDAGRQRTDAGVGPNKPHDVLRYAVSGFLPAIGMSNAQALQANTSVAAEVCGLEARKGTIEAGKDADIIAVPGNPLDDITCLQRIFAVIVAGNQIGSPT